MSAIPDDIMERARTLYAGLWANDSRDNLSDHDKREDILEIALALQAERQRTADLIEEVRKAADMVLNNPAFFTTTYEARPYAMITFDNADSAHRFNDGLIALRALLSKLGER